MYEFKFLKPQKMLHPTTGQTLEYLDKQSAVAALIISNDEKTGYFVTQFRPGLRKEIIEVVAGLIDKGEHPLEAMYREVREESGYSKEELELLYSSKPLAISPGYTSEKLSLYILKLKKNAKQKELRLDKGEDLTGNFYDFNYILRNSEDFKTHYLIHLYELLKKN